MSNGVDPDRLEFERISRALRVREDGPDTALSPIRNLLSVEDLAMKFLLLPIWTGQRLFS